ncbi:hypothetical protein CRUP_024157 [Coryphaenoides rupestris]|nr:hypothetical protein CRUP_024157 [Coryphaenoides rupestris]
MKATLSSAEEGRARASAHSKNMEKENWSLIAKITSLQTSRSPWRRTRLGKLCDLNADLQVQVHSFDGFLAENEHLILEKSRQVEELKNVVEEYSSVTEGVSGPSALDKTLDKEVLLLLQGPNPEHMALEFRGLLSRLVQYLLM